jgi:hypothetical protein
MHMNRRLEKLETQLPENAFSVRVLFKHEGEPDPVVDPPLNALEKQIMVVFVDPKRRR